MEIKTPVLTKEQADMVERIKEEKDINYALERHADETRSWTSFNVGLNALRIDELAIALIHGYEVEQTAEERLAEYYKEYKGIIESPIYNLQDKIFAGGVVSAINAMLNIESRSIQGINKEANE
ncbi:hypothetical protein [Geomicrobium sediminis]|uniref:Phage protein n=1 Tax=Geomicrobium sediminis TaxID=1347788 RepID=A0ABS2PFB1_9BACL|nr:hypothetical protein [Geomicrobium sediminis]MBM7634046.1 hypothetical protein [Geomicrobium sediminis]